VRRSARSPGWRKDALLWATAWIAENAIEVLDKTVISRPGLEAAGPGVFDQSFPSGHAIRAVVVVALLGLVWPRTAWPAGCWAFTVLVALTVSGAHTPSEVAGGLLIGLMLAVVVHRSTRRPSLLACIGLEGSSPEDSMPPR
jgi:membrane-associated phospholipid phosphatase